MLINLPMSSGTQPLTCIDLQKWTTTVSLLQNSGRNSNALAVLCCVDSRFQVNKSYTGKLPQRFKLYFGSADPCSFLFVCLFFKWKLFKMLTDTNSHFRKIWPILQCFCSPSKPCDWCRSWHISRVTSLGTGGLDDYVGTLQKDKY